MQYLDKLLPLAILLAIGLLVAFFARRSAREKKRPLPVDLVPVRIETREPIAPVGVLQTPIVPETVTPSAPLPPITAEENSDRLRPKNKRRRILPPIAVAVETPIVKVLGLLREEDALAAGFLLSVILAPPVSRRK